MPNYSKKIVYLSEAQKAELFTNHTLSVNGNTITFNENDIYITPQEQPYIKPANGIPASDLATGVVNVTDVQVVNNSILNNGIANIPAASTTNYGLIKIGDGLGLSATTGKLQTNSASTSTIKQGTAGQAPIVPGHQHESAFYGLTKAAGVDMKNSENAVGTYTDEAKQAIQKMLGFEDILGNYESSTTASKAYTVGETFIFNGKRYRVTADIAQDYVITPGTNCELDPIDSRYVRDTDYASTDKAGVVRYNNDYGISVIMSGAGIGTLRTYSAFAAQIKAGTNAYRPIVPEKQHEAVFYGLSKLAGVDLASSDTPVGTYTIEAKTAIRNMLGATSNKIIAIQDEQPTDTDTKIWLPETENTGIQVPTYEEFQALDATVVKKTDYATQDTAGAVKVNTYGAYGVRISTEINGDLRIMKADSTDIKSGTPQYRPIVPYLQHESVFYGLAKAAGDTTQTVSDNAVGTYTSGASAAIRSMLGAISNTDYATSTIGGVVRVATSNGVAMTNDGQIYINQASTNNVKLGTANYYPIVPSHQHEAAFYGLAKAAGDTTMASSSNTVGTYTTEAKAAIQSMLGIDLASIASQVDIPLVETVSGTTPTITGQPNVRYVCGEVSTLTITPPASGSVDVIFESGSTATTLTVPSTVKWPAWFDAEALEANTTYEILIIDGIYGSVMTWAT